MDHALRPLLRLALQAAPAVLAAHLIAAGAQAQTFRGVAPGDPALALEVFGEPDLISDFGPGPDGVMLSAFWILEDQDVTTIHLAGGHVLYMVGSDLAPRGRVRFGETTAAQMIDIAGSEPGYFSGGSQMIGQSDPRTSQAAWPVDAEHSVYLLVNFFDDARPEPTEGDASFRPVSDDAVVFEVRLVHEDFLQLSPESFGTFVSGQDTAPVGPLDAIFTE